MKRKVNCGDKVRIGIGKVLLLIAAATTPLAILIIVPIVNASPAQTAELQTITAPPTRRVCQIAHGRQYPSSLAKEKSVVAQNFLRKKCLRIRI